MLLAAQAACRGQPLSSNVRPQNRAPAVPVTLSQLQHFRYDFFPVWRLQTTICTASIFVIWLLLASVLDRPLTKPDIYLSLATSAFCAVILAVVTATVRFGVSSTGLRTFNTLGQWREVDWKAVSAAVPSKYYFLPHLRLTVEGQSRKFWVPLFLRDMKAFRAAVIECAGEGNPVSRALPVPAVAAYRNEA